MKVGRNEPCPCGKGKKFKNCCGRGKSIGFDNPSAQFRDVIATVHCGETLKVYGSKMLKNRVDREAAKIAEGFDQLCQNYIVDIEEIYSAVGSLLHHGKEQAKMQGDELRSIVGTVLSNSLRSFTAAFSLLRTGWRLQPYHCIRNSYETLSVAIHLAINPQDLEKFKRDELASTKTFASAKHLMPLFGRVYGDLSEQFIHVGTPYRHEQLGVKYTKDEEDLWACLGTC
jgi:hypothetical protein